MVDFNFIRLSIEIRKSEASQDGVILFEAITQTAQEFLILRNKKLEWYTVDYNGNVDLDKILCGSAQEFLTDKSQGKNYKALKYRESVINSLFKYNVSGVYRGYNRAVHEDKKINCLYNALRREVISGMPLARLNVIFKDYRWQPKDCFSVLVDAGSWRDDEREKVKPAVSYENAFTFCPSKVSVFNESCTYQMQIQAIVTCSTYVDREFLNKYKTRFVHDVLETVKVKLEKSKTDIPISYFEISEVTVYKGNYITVTLRLRKGIVENLA